MTSAVGSRSISAHDYRALFAAPGAYLIVSPEFVVVDASDGYLRATMSGIGEVVGRELLEVLPLDHGASAADELMSSLVRVRDTCRPDAMPMQRVRLPLTDAEAQDWEHRYWNPINFPVLDRLGNLTFIIHRIQDVSAFTGLAAEAGQHGRLMSEVAERAERFDAEIVAKALRPEEASRLIEAQEQERRRIAGELHDDPIQAMTAVQLQLQRMRRSPEPSDLLEVAREAERATSAAIARMRNMVFELLPESLEREGFVATVEALLDNTFSGTDISWEVHQSLSIEPARATGFLAYRQVREAIANVLKHSRADMVNVEISPNGPGGVTVAIADDGIGFVHDPTAPPEPGHIGLGSLVNRARGVAGGCTIDSKPGSGTTVTFWLPALRPLQGSDQLPVSEEDMTSQITSSRSTSSPLTT